MQRSLALPSRSAFVIAAALATFAVLALSGCKSIDAPNTDTRGAVQSTGTVQAELPPSTITNSPANTPAKVESFAGSFRGPVWYPGYIPKGFKIVSVDVVELEPGSGLVCDIMYTHGAKGLTFAQGSPKQRDYEIVSAGKTAWGGETADVVYEDPADKATPRMIVYGRDGNFAELSGDVSFAQLKAVAASMARVK